MAIAYPVRAKAHIKVQSQLAFQTHMQGVRGSIHNANNITRHALARDFDEPQSAEAAAVNKVLMLPKT